MQLSDFKQVLDANTNAKLQFLLPDGSPVPVHFHLTEVGRVDKHFIDCGGVARQSQTCQLQLWFADDIDHRLTTDKLANILNMAGPILGEQDLPVDVEYGQEIAGLYSIDSVMSVFGTLKIQLRGKQTDCLAKDKCDVGSSGCC